jgi:fumarate reductase flavoprotein subunit
MWDDVGIIRDKEGLDRATTELDDIAAEIQEAGVADDDRAFNLTWHDRLNLESLVEISKAITFAALAREDSRGAHFRADFPESGDLDKTAFTVVSRKDGNLSATTRPVKFTIVKPGESLIDDAVGAPPAAAQ